MKLLWQDLPSEGKIEVGSRVRLKELVSAQSYASGQITVPPGTKGTVVGLPTPFHACVQYDNIILPSQLFPHYKRTESDDGWLAYIKHLELI